MRSLVARIVLSVVAITGLVFLGACGGGTSPSTAETAGTTTTIAASTSTESSSTVLSSSTTATGSVSSTTSSSTTSTVPPVIIPGVSTVSYENSQYGFSLERPETATLSTEGFDGFLPLTQAPVVAIILPPDLFKGTNLIEAGVYIGASSSPAVISKWNLPVADKAEAGAGTSEINGISFAVFTSAGAAAGNIYEEKVYRALRNDVCFEIVELFHSGNIANYESGSVVAFDEAKFQGYLEAIVRTFAFVSE